MTWSNANGRLTELANRKTLAAARNKTTPVTGKRPLKRTMSESTPSLLCLVGTAGCIEAEAARAGVHENCHVLLKRENATCADSFDPASDTRHLQEAANRECCSHGDLVG